MATAPRTPIKGIVNYSNMSSGIEVDLNTSGKAGSVTTLIATDFNDVVTSDIFSVRQTLSVGAGNDMLVGGGYMTIFDGGAGNDTVNYGMSDRSIYGDLALGVATNGDTYIGIENLIGGAGNNTLLGNDGVNRLVGGVSADYLDGRAGADYMAGGDASDIYVVDDAGDMVVELANQGANDQVNATISYKLTDNVEHLVLTGSADISGTGNGLANSIYGNGGGNKLDGAAGNDTLVGAGGADTLTGGSGKDVFRYVAAADSKVTAMDHITDFTRAEDKLDFKSIDANSKTGANDTFKFVGTADFSNKAGELRYETHDSYTLVQGDVNGDGVADFAINLDGYTGVLKSADFIL